MNSAVASMDFSSAQTWIAVSLGTAATIEDLWRRRISNWIPLAALAGGLLCHGLERGWRGLASAGVGAVGGFCVFLVFYLLGGMGGGDVKLMAGLGAVIGAGRLLEAALWTAACGGVLAALVIACNALRGLGRAGSRRTQRPPQPPEAASGSTASNSGEAAVPVRAAESLSIPYAPAITLGVWLALLGSG